MYIMCLINIIERSPGLIGLTWNFSTRFPYDMINYITFVPEEMFLNIAPLISIHLISDCCCREDRFWPIPCFFRIMPRRFPSQTIHRVSRCSGNLPFLLGQIQFLVDYHWSDKTVPSAYPTNVVKQQRRWPHLKGVPVSCLST